MAEGATSEQSTQLIRELRLALATFEEHNTAGGDIVTNEPWMIWAVGGMVVMAGWLARKSAWSAMMKLMAAMRRGK